MTAAPTRAPTRAATGARPRPVLRLPASGSVLVSPRAAVVGVVLALLVVVVAAASLALGDVDLPLGRVIGVLAGRGSRSQSFVVLDLRLPRIALAVLVGAALAVSGALFQGIARNSLASPDLLGFTAGGATGAVLAIVLFSASAAGTTVGAVVGTLVTALVVQALLGRASAGYRLVLVGIGVQAMLVALDNFLISRADLTVAVAAQTWIIGDLNGRGWAEVVAAGSALVVLAPLAMAGSRRLDLMGMGDDAARSLGVDVGRTRTGLLLVGVGLVGVATACTGPIAFVALAAPQIARRLTGVTGPGVVGAGLTGALLLLVADLLGRRLLSPTTLPAGVLTAGIGGLYLVWLLAREWRAGR